MNKNYVLLPILWYTKEEMEVIEENEKRIEIGLKPIDIHKEEIYTKEVAFFGFSEITTHDYQGHDFCKIYSNTNNEYICTMTIYEVLNLIKSLSFDND